MDDIQFNKNLNAAWDLMEDEANRTRANFQPNTTTAAEPQQSQQHQPNTQPTSQQQHMPYTTPSSFSSRSQLANPSTSHPRCSQHLSNSNCQRCPPVC